MIKLLLGAFITLGLIGPAMAQERILISADWGKVTAELVDNNATRSLIQMLPLTIEMRDQLRQEKTDLRRQDMMEWIAAETETWPKIAAFGVCDQNGVFQLLRYGIANSLISLVAGIFEFPTPVPRVSCQTYREECEWSIACRSLSRRQYHSAISRVRGYIQSGAPFANKTANPGYGPKLLCTARNMHHAVINL